MFVDKTLLAGAKFFPDRVGVAAIVSCYKFVNFLLKLTKVLLFGRAIPVNINKILIFRTGNIGDIICAIPAMKAVRDNYPNAHITLLSSPGQAGSPGAKELLSGAKFLDDLTIYYKEGGIRSIFNLIRNLRKRKFDLFIQFPQNLENLRLIRNIIFARVIGADYAFGFQANSFVSFGRLQSQYLRFESEAERLLGIVKQEGLKTDRVSFALPVSEEDKRIVNGFLKEISDKKFLVLAPNSAKQTCQWPLERFVEVGKWLAENYDLRILIAGGEKDRERSEKAAEMIGNEVLNITGRFTILQSTELLKYAACLIANNTGIAHMAATVKTPTVGVYAARDFKNRWHPSNENCIILRKEPECQACFKVHCEHLTCLKMISTDEVCQAVAKVLNN